MISRSMPPASAHLALRPVPAPPPMIGRPSAIFLRNDARISLRDGWNMIASSSRRATQQGQQRIGGGRPECRVVDVFVAASTRTQRMPLKPSRIALNNARSAAGSSNGCPGRVERGYSAQREHHDRRTLRVSKHPAIPVPSAAFSSGVVRISVTDGLWT